MKICGNDILNHVCAERLRRRISGDTGSSLPDSRQRIWIDPFDACQINPNSYDLRLAAELLVYRLKDGTPDPYLDPCVDNPTDNLHIPKGGLVLKPGRLYLGRTVEYTETVGFVPMIEGKSTLGRLGLNIHMTAGYGDESFRGVWVLELCCVHPVLVYPDMKIAQIVYDEVTTGGPHYAGKYQGQREVVAARIA